MRGSPWRFFKKIPGQKFRKKSKKLANLGFSAPEKDSPDDLGEIPQQIFQIDALAATFWAKNKIFEKLQNFQKLSF